MRQFAGRYIPLFSRRFKDTLRSRLKTTIVTKKMAPADINPVRWEWIKKQQIKFFRTEKQYFGISMRRKVEKDNDMDIIRKAFPEEKSVERLRFYRDSGKREESVVSPSSTSRCLSYPITGRKMFHSKLLSSARTKKETRHL
ncbi:hypothetical protein CRE_30383 [Caenorhabditis remanei]|uniref:Uncharacterized protein n=1 Tax=Caenorhabditis remanei TaxID=31234 RepID=E3N5Z8_CAERE|nr:hypothetical protein CRE_30383 [Caenorhabditis remanei]